MKIITVNVPESYIDTINKLIGENGLYPSRSELVRVATREFLLKELKLAKNIKKFSESKEDLSNFDLENDNLVRIPIEKRDANNEPKIEFKTYKIVRRLENPND